MKPHNEGEVEKNHAEVTTGASQYSPPQMLASENLSHDGIYVQHNLSGKVFEITAKYTPIELIGIGANGIICSALNSETNEKVAIKKIMHAFDRNAEAKRTLREIKLLRHFKHENIVEIKDVILPHLRYEYEDVYVACEYMDCDLQDVINSTHELNELHHKFLLYQILRGLKYIHSANVLHRDLKPSNLLVNAQCDLKISDFGHAREESHVMTEYVVTRWYRAPELILNSSAYTAAIDVWSVGCIFMELLNRKPLLQGDGAFHQLRLIMELVGTPLEDELGSLNESPKRYLASLTPLPRQPFAEIFPNVPLLAIDLVERMLQFDPRRRISVEDALAHPYLEGIHNPMDEPECMTLFNSVFDQDHPPTRQQLKELIYNEALSFKSEQATTEEH